jgi:predicted component of type VI protein secretion system
MECPYIRIEESGATTPLIQDVTTVGRGRFVDVQLTDPSVSMLHAEIVCRGPYLYVTDLGLSRNGTWVNGRLVARRLLADGDVVTFGSARCRVAGILSEELSADAELRRPAAPELTRRELDVVTSLCRPALSDEAFVAPATAREMAVDLVVTEAAVKQHLLRLYQKFRIPEGPNRRVRLANEVVAHGLVRPLPQSELPERLPATAPQPAAGIRSRVASAALQAVVPAQAGPIQASTLPPSAVPPSTVPASTVQASTVQAGHGQTGASETARTPAAAWLAGTS